ncbi:plakophilin-2-like [Arapaima gigas]
MASTDSDFIKTALSARDASRFADDTSLALPLEGKLCDGQPDDMSSRVQRQVRLTLARKGGKAPSNGKTPSLAPTLKINIIVLKDLNQETELKQRWDTVQRSQKISTYRVVGSPASSPDLSIHAAPGHRRFYSEVVQQGTYTLTDHSPIVSRTSQLSRTWSPRATQCYYSIQEPYRRGLGNIDDMGETLRSGGGSLREAFRSGGGSMGETLRGGVGSMGKSLRSGGGSLREAFRSGGGGMSEGFRGGVAWHQQRPFTDKPQLDSLTFLRMVRKGTGPQIDKQGSSPASLVNMDTEGLTGQVGMTQGTVKSEVGQVPEQVLIGQKHNGQALELTLERAVSLLEKETPDIQVTAANYIQNRCFISQQARKQVFNLQGISKLIQLWQSNNEQLHKVAAGALRNVVFENNDNKMQVKDKGGVEALLNVLKSSRDREIRKQLTGLLWNLSSHDLLKDYLCREALQILTDSVIVPCSGIDEGENPKDYILADPDTFYNATGCLRNLSSAGPDSRGAMRKCVPLIDALVHYVQGTIADHKPDDKSTENCVCILHNLSYQMYHLTDAHLSEQNLAPRSKGIGCFGFHSRDMIQHSEKQLPLVEEKNSPHGVEWLGCPIIVRMYLSLIARSTRKCTQEAATGALQNITAGNRMVSFTMAYTIVRKENGLLQMKKVLREGEQDVKRTAVSLLRNISCYREFHSDIVKQVLPELIALLPNLNSTTDVPSEVTVTLCQILTNLSQSEGLNVRAIVNQGGLGKIIKISTKENGFGPTRAGQAASILLHTMWQHKELHSAYIKAGYRKADFINSKTVKALSSIENLMGEIRTVKGQNGK